MKKRIWLALCAALMTAVFALSGVACKGNTKPTPPPGGDLDEEVELTGELNIFFNEQGYGRLWMNALVDQFKLFHPKVEVNFIGELYNTNGINDIENGEGTFDLVFAGTSLARYAVPDATGKTLLMDISDVANKVQADDTRSAAQKLEANGLNDMCTYNGKYYMLPWMTTLSGLHYNKTTLDNVFGEGKWKEPVTTDEFSELLADLAAIESKKPAATRAYGITVSPEISYWSYMATAWWAQYDGMKAYKDFYYAEYNDDGVQKVAGDSETFRRAMNPTGRLKALEAVQRIIGNKANINPVSEDIKFEDHQKQFATGRYQNTANPSAFISCGDWYELETAAAVQQAGEPIRFMRTPVLSSIVETLKDTAMTDETLQAVIRAIDEGATEYDGVDPEDFARIKEARQMVTCGAGNHMVGIPASAPNVRNAKEFLVLFASELGQEAFALATGGLVPPYDYDIMASEAFTKSEYVKSIYSAYYDKLSFLPVGSEEKAPLVMFGGVEGFAMLNNIDNKFANEGVTAQNYNQLIVNTLAAKYTTVSRYISPTPRG